MSGEKLPAERCRELGLCNRVVAAESLLEEALQWAQELAGKAPLALRHAKAALNFAIEQGVADTISEEARLQAICIASADAREGVAAFTEKRAPQWQGK